MDLELANINFHAHATFIGDFPINLANPCWKGGKGKDLVEMYVSRRLFGSLICSCDSDCGHISRWPHRRYDDLEEIHTPAVESAWPSSYGPINEKDYGFVHDPSIRLSPVLDGQSVIIKQPSIIFPIFKFS